MFIIICLYLFYILFPNLIKGIYYKHFICIKFKKKINIRKKITYNNIDNIF